MFTNSFMLFSEFLLDIPDLIRCIQILPLVTLLVLIVHLFNSTISIFFFMIEYWETSFFLKFSHMEIKTKFIVLYLSRQGCNTDGCPSYFPMICLKKKIMQWRKKTTPLLYSYMYMCVHANAHTHTLEKLITCIHL